ncbi:flagellar protein FlgJ [Vibrio xiamenensis]|uniref:Flagellar protein FlgJ n=1 Tax=Vibrio xiamenensis TaxID=861298 RepID=A0A1G7Y2Y5_9VIBR|nr:rod-binding protein [Vibrio xiamenensis]SDG90781.1 flagellar protein FlgJ [Vibrio xiamenensis]
MNLDGVNNPAQLNSLLYQDNKGLENIKHAADQHQALKTVAGQFEAMFLQLVLRRMRAGSDAIADKDSPFSSQQQGVFRDMYDGQLAMEMAKKQSSGIADMLVKQLSPNVQDTGMEQASNVIPAQDAFNQTALERKSQAGDLLANNVNATEQVVTLSNKASGAINSTAFAQPLIRKMEL